MQILSNKLKATSVVLRTNYWPVGADLPAPASFLNGRNTRGCCYRGRGSSGTGQ